MEKKARLGRGLEALLGGPDPETAATATATEIRIDEIHHNPWQPRKTFDNDDMSALSESIRNHGVLQPLVVRQSAEGFQLIAGERRLRAAKAAGLDAVPVHVVNFNDQQVLEAALVENIQRTDLNPIEKAHGFKEYLDRFSMTHDELAKRLGLARPTISNLVGLLDLAAEIQEYVRTGMVSLGHAKILKSIPETERQISLCKEIIARGLSVRDLDALLADQKQTEQTTEAATEPTTPKTPVEKTTHVKGMEDELRQRLAVKVEIKLKARDRGQIVLAFESNDDFERLDGSPAPLSPLHPLQEKGDSMFRRNIPAVLLIVLTPLLSRGDDSKYEPSGGNYSIQMPTGKVLESTSEIAIPGGKTTLTMATVEVGKDVAFMVMYNEYPPEVSKVKPEDILKGCANGLKTKERSVVSEKDISISVGDAKYPGKEMQVSKGATYLNARMYLVGNRLYQIMVIGPKDVVNNAETTAYLDSFAVTK